MNLLAELADFANLPDDPKALRAFWRKHPSGFAPFVLVKGEGKNTTQISPWEDQSFHKAVLAWRELLRRVWKGKGRQFQLEILLGIFPQAYANWPTYSKTEQFLQREGETNAEYDSRMMSGHKVDHADMELADLWEEGRKAIESAGCRILRLPPMSVGLRAVWETGEFEFRPGNDFSAAVYALWRQRWRARVCPMCDSYFSAKQKAQKFCSEFCAQQGKREANRRWWRTSGPDWRARLFEEKRKAERMKQRKDKRSMNQQTKGGE